MTIQYISWNYGTIRGIRYHMVRYTDGAGKLFTDEEMVRKGLAKWNKKS